MAAFAFDELPAIEPDRRALVWIASMAAVFIGFAGFALRPDHVRAKLLLSHAEAAARVARLDPLPASRRLSPPPSWRCVTREGDYAFIPAGRTPEEAIERRFHPDAIEGLTWRFEAKRSPSWVTVVGVDADGSTRVAMDLTPIHGGWGYNAVTECVRT